MFSSFQWNSLNKTQAHEKANLLKNEDKPSRFLKKKKRKKKIAIKISIIIFFSIVAYLL